MTRTIVATALVPLLLLTTVLFAGCGESTAQQSEAPDDLVYIIEPNTMARQLRGENIDLIPSEIQVQQGQTIEIRNDDHAVHYFLSSSIWSGQTLRKTFNEPGTFRYSGAFTCSIGERPSLTIVVSEAE